MSDCGMTMKIAWTCTVWPKGQIVLPKELRDKLGIEPWESMVVILKNDKFIWLVKNDDMWALKNFISN